MKALYLIKRGPRPSHHAAPFHPVILCSHKLTAKWEAGATDDAAWVWEKGGWDDNGRGWLLVRWNGFDVDYGNLVRSIKMPDGSCAAFWRDYDSDLSVKSLFPGAVWWSEREMPRWISQRGVVYPTDLHTQHSILSNWGDEKRSSLVRPSFWVEAKQ